MTLYRLGKRSAERVAAEPELCMGYQVGRGGDRGRSYFIVMGGLVAIDLSSLGDSDTASKLALLAGSVTVDGEEMLFSKMEQLEILNKLDLTNPDSILSAVNSSTASGTTGGSMGGKPIVGHASSRAGSPMFGSTTTHPTVFCRYGALPIDRRFNASGDLSPGSYATTINDSRMVPSGAAAVGRYALPVPAPARYCFHFTVPAGTAYSYGTVWSNFGLGGGGAEIWFPQGAKATGQNGTAHTIIPEV